MQILEVCTDTIPAAGTRVCAYWSQQYRCLYPGTVPVPSADDTDYDPRLVSVDFDDGDNGRISLQDIRLLPQDYPIVGEMMLNLMETLFVHVCESKLSKTIVFYSVEIYSKLFKKLKHQQLTLTFFN